MTTTLPLYWNLSSNIKDERIDATIKLIDTVLEFQSQYAPSPSEAREGAELLGKDEKDEKEREDEEESDENAETSIDVLNAEDVRYAIRRLVRGLASPRESSRLGFAVALTEVRLSRICALSLMKLTQVHCSFFLVSRRCQLLK